MWLNASTDYAIRMLICLSRASGAVSSSKLARTIGVSPVICFRSEPDCGMLDSSMWGMAQPAAISYHDRRLK